MIRRFWDDETGAFAIMTAVLTIGLIAAAGLAIDYAMVLREKERLQASLDAGILAAAHHDGTIGEKRQVIENFMVSNHAGAALGTVKIMVTETEAFGGLAAKADVRHQTYLMPIVGINHVDLSVEAEVRSGTDAWLDIALVLDNTASLEEQGLQAVKNAAQQFRTSVLSVAPSPNRIQMAVVPFAGAVNVGRNFPNAYLDVQARSKWHAHWMESKWIGQLDGCIPDWGSGENTDPGDGTIEGWLRLPDWMEQYGAMTGHALASVAGITAAQAQTRTPQEAGLPDGWTTYYSPDTGCTHLITPWKINNFDLFNGIGNIRWAGCVEARPAPYDVTDHAPAGSTWDTYFVPYFWPDEVDVYEEWIPKHTNDFMPDHGPLLPWNPQDYAIFDNWGRSHTPTTYDGRNVALRAGGEFVSGPNRGCPQPLLPLTGNQDKVNTAIASMQLVDGGGTVISEGVAWGWRVLSPTPPFTEGNTAKGTKRIMVVMSDGQNQLSRNPRNPGPWGYDHRNTATVSDYNAYGYLRYSRFRTQQEIDYNVTLSFEEAEARIDERMSQVCTNAKKDDIEIYAVLFASTEQRAIDALRNCATSPGHFFLASDAAKLSETFANIGQSVGRLRLVR